MDNHADQTTAVETIQALCYEAERLRAEGRREEAAMLVRRANTLYEETRSLCEGRVARPERPLWHIGAIAGVAAAGVIVLGFFTARVYNADCIAQIWNQTIECRVPDPIDDYRHGE